MKYTNEGQNIFIEYEAATGEQVKELICIAVSIEAANIILKALNLITKN